MGAADGRARFAAILHRGHGPLPHFILLGALLFAAKQFTSDGRTLGLGADPIVVSIAQVEQLRAEWLAETRRAPTREELAAAVRRHADEEMLLREALRLGLDRSDPVVRSRLVQNLRFARGDPAADEAAAFAEALALGMAQRDVVTRRRLVQAMEQRLAATPRVTDREVVGYIAANPERYAPRPRMTFDQVFIARDPQGAALLPGAHVVAQTEADLARTFGAEFARAVMQAPAGQWAGPFGSAYGIHVVRVSQVETGGAEPAVRQAYYALLEEKERAAIRTALTDLRRAYPVQTEWPALALAGVR